MESNRTLLVTIAESYLAGTLLYVCGSVCMRSCMCKTMKFLNISNSSLFNYLTEHCDSLYWSFSVKAHVGTSQAPYCYYRGEAILS